MTNRDLREQAPDWPDHTLADLQRDHIAQVLDSGDGNKARAARSLGLDLRSLYRRIDRYGLDLTARGSQR